MSAKARKNETEGEIHPCVVNFKTTNNIGYQYIDLAWDTVTFTPLDSTRKGSKVVYLTSTNVHSVKITSDSPSMQYFLQKYCIV